MWREIVKQVLTSTLALLGALLGVILGTFFVRGHALDPHAWQWVISLGLVGVVMILYLVAEAARIEQRVRNVGRRLRLEIDRAATLEHNARDGLYPVPADFEAAIEAWRTRVNAYLARNLRHSGADIRFRTGIGDVGPTHAYQHTRLKDLKQNLVAILDALPSYVGRSH
jgi:MFS family permease